MTNRDERARKCAAEWGAINSQGRLAIPAEITDCLSWFDPDRDRIEVSIDLSRPKVMTIRGLDEVTRALEAGSTGYLLKDSSPEDFMKAFATVRAGKPYLSHDLALQVALVHAPARRNPLAELTPRELQILSLLAEAKAYGQIAEDLGVSYKTVVNVSYQLKQKLDARNLSELIRIAVQLLSAANI